jgi:CheY-like chemotaxis protein
MHDQGRRSTAHDPDEEQPLPPYIVVVEDDHLQEGPLVDQLEDAFPGGRIESVSTEREFRERLTHLHRDPPDLVVMDVMLRWAYPSRDVTEPSDYEGFYRAGLRCAEAMGSDSRLRRVPIILYTILERGDLERDGSRISANAIYLRKSTDLTMLLRKVQELVDA